MVDRILVDANGRKEDTRIGPINEWLYSLAVTFRTEISPSYRDEAIWHFTWRTGGMVRAVHISVDELRSGLICLTFSSLAHLDAPNQKVTAHPRLYQLIMPFVKQDLEDTFELARLDVNSLPRGQ